MEKTDTVQECWNKMSTPKVMERMRYLLDTNKWHDCVFKLKKADDGKEELVYAHNLILGCSSPVFEALCFGPMAEKGPIEVPDVDPTAFKMMLQFIYTDFIEFPSVETACNVLYVSKKYLIYTLTSLAISYILCQICESNCLQIYEFANFVQEDDLIKGSWNYLCSHLGEVLKCFSNESLPTDLIKKLVNQDYLNGGESVLFKFCLLWAEAECKKKNLEKSSENLRKLLIEAGILNKIRWMTFSLEDFNEGPRKSGVLTADESVLIVKGLNSINHTENKCLVIDKNNIEYIAPDYMVSTEDKKSENEFSQKELFESTSLPSSINNTLEARKKIEPRKFYCHRFLVKEVGPRNFSDQLKIKTYISANRSLKITGIFLHAKILPKYITYICSFNNERDYIENLLVRVFNSNDELIFSFFVIDRVIYGTVFKILLPTPVVLEKLKQCKIQIEFLNSTENYHFGVRNSVSVYSSGLKVTFKELANTGENGSFVEASELSIITGLELCL